MKRTLKLFSVSTVILIICCMLCACGDITNQDPKLWPKKGPAASVPKPSAGEIIQALTKEDVDGKAFSIITIGNFTADNMGDYIRLLLDKGFSTYDSQRVNGNYITYSAKKGDKMVALSLNTDENELKVEIE